MRAFHAKESKKATDINRENLKILNKLVEISKGRKVTSLNVLQLTLDQLCWKPAPETALENKHLLLPWPTPSTLGECLPQHRLNLRWWLFPAALAPFIPTEAANQHPDHRPARNLPLLRGRHTGTFPDLEFGHNAPLFRKKERI
jgi:hypothetical protein